ncbi:DsbA family protein [Jannaschia seohaensis]|uniref:Protein-disulfide isomerase n=1 Tax=Jannaschia seohaensis TaxID=475081 RepID=A0A2Y9C8L6_9RHOB|nr:DsbA family protein [Jannaschia seohaensis]PWJ15830.1 protein-disulfide isomerase [Jannaschia seohaensis]SSA49523.1 Protein-disulfide isomerase [Jannaschia seohaensis]
MSVDPAGDTPRPLPRRGALLAIAAAAVGAWWAWPRIAPHFVGVFDFEPLDDPPGFRRIAAGETSGIAQPFIGLEAPGAADSPLPPAELRANLCGSLFGGPSPAGAVPIAAFSDYNCPFCRVLTERLSDLQARSESGVRVTWHEWPRLGTASVAAARAALAADMQGAYAAFHRRLMRSRFVPTPEYLQALAREIGVDGDRLRADMESDAVSQRLRITSALARLFGFVGTPALVVGRTVVVGAVSEPVLAALLDQERREGPPPVCRV